MRVGSNIKFGFLLAGFLIVQATVAATVSKPVSGAYTGPSGVTISKVVSIPDPQTGKTDYFGRGSNSQLWFSTDLRTWSSWGGLLSSSANPVIASQVEAGKVVVYVIWRDNKSRLARATSGYWYNAPCGTGLLCSASTVPKPVPVPVPAPIPAHVPAPAPAPLPIHTPRVISVWGGARGAITLRSDGTVWTWGDNYWGSGADREYGMLGNGTRLDQRVPRQVPGLTNVIQVSGGDDFSAVLKADGTVWTFGGNWAGQLGNGDPMLADQLKPVKVVGLTNVIYITARDFHAQAIRSDGTVWSWGSGIQGELGVPCVPLTILQAQNYGASPPAPYCRNSNVPLKVQWP
ncbi:MAG: RCC1 domain-containing protein [Bdellovibrionales bacterium]